MKNRLKSVFMALAVILLGTSCANDVTSSEEIDGSAIGSNLLRVKTRAASNSEAVVATPINMYIFNEKSKCVAHKQIATSGDDATFKLTEGNFTIYSIAGANEETYNLPSKDNATLETVISLKEGKQLSDFMTATNTVILSNEEEQTRDLEMCRKVLMLKAITMTNVPDEVTEIKASISPLYENIKLNGEYSGENGAAEISLSKQENNTTWNNSCNLYMLPSVGKPTIKLTFKYADGSSKLFTYTSKNDLEANYKISMAMNYIKIKEPTLKFEIHGVAWNGDDSWEIDVDEKDFTEIENGGGGSDTPEPDETDIPKAGEFYKGCYVITSETSGNTTTITLLSPNDKTNLEFDPNDQASVKVAISEAMVGLGVADISGWRLPTEAEMRYVNSNKSSINKTLIANSQPNIPNSHNYFVLLNDGNIGAFSTGSAMTVTLKSNHSSSHLRPFATVTFNK